MKRVFFFLKRYLKNSLWPEHNRVHQGYVPCESTHEILYRRRENLDKNLQVLPLPKTLRVCVYNNVRYHVQSCDSNYDNLLRSSARDTKLSKLRIKTCNYRYKEHLETSKSNGINKTFAIRVLTKSNICLLSRCFLSS